MGFKKNDWVMLSIPESTDLWKYNVLHDSHLGYCQIFRVAAVDGDYLTLYHETQKLPTGTSTLYLYVMTKDRISEGAEYCCKFPTEFCKLISEQEVEDYKILRNL